VYGQPYFSASNFPANMAAIWEAHFGFIPAATGRAMVLGEWGGPYSGKDAQWMNALKTYLLSKGMTDQFFWCLNPDSGDTGGLLQNDWVSPVSDKLTMLAGLVSTPTKFAVNSAGQVCINGGTTAASPSASPAAAQASASSTPAARASSSPAAAASPSHSPAAQTSPAATPAAGGITFASGSSVWWLAVTIPGSSSVKIDCGNGQGFVSMTPGWTANLWTFSSGNGQACKSSVQFIVNGGSAQSVTAPF
jgi:endoglucanase